VTDDRSALQPAGQGIHRKLRAPRPPGIPGFTGGDPRTDYVRAFGIREVTAAELGDLYPAFLAWGKTTNSSYPTTLRRLDELVHRFRCHQATVAAVAALDAELTPRLDAEIEGKPS
jgi:hypothetical protein